MTANQITGSIDILISFFMIYLSYFSSAEKLKKKIIGKFTYLTLIKIGWPFSLATGILKFVGVMAA